ncbi:MAG: putative MPP superfamily phosphohydrolase, partial [Flavobacteriales bacterium]
MNRALIFLLAILLFVELYSYKAITQWLTVYLPDAKKMSKLAYWIISVLTIGTIIYVITKYRSGSKDMGTLVNLAMGLFVVIYLPKLFIATMHLFDDVLFFGRSIIDRVRSVPVANDSRRHFITTIGLGAGAFLFGGLIYGIMKGKFNFTVMEEDIYSDKIPKSFDGCKIVQISDAHLGSFANAFEPIEKAVEMINNLEADYVFFTGDMVNNNAKEALPWVEIFSKIKAKKGKYSIFGNHDYADYGGQSKEARIESIRLLKEIHKNMGFRLLEDEHVVLTEDQESISLIGVHNWGHGFHQVGDLDKAIDGVEDKDFKILLSHDPTHFDHKVLEKTNIDLTLSGHTHGMQLGIEIPKWNIKWSPVKYRYKKWAGL